MWVCQNCESENENLVSKCLVCGDLNLAVPPRISTFTTSQETIISSQFVTLNWEIENEAQKITLEPGNFDVTTLSEIKVDPKLDTKYTLTASNHFGETSKALSIKVLKAPTYIAKPKDQNLKLGDKIKLEWKVMDCLKIEWLEYGTRNEVKFNDSIEISPSKTTTYILITTATDNKSEFVHEFTIQVIEPVKIVAFEAKYNNPIETIENEIYWKVENAKSIELYEGFDSVDTKNKNNYVYTSKKDMNFRLKVSNEVGFEEQIISIKNEPIPRIKFIESSIPNINIAFELNLNTSINLGIDNSLPFFKIKKEINKNSKSKLKELFNKITSKLLKK